MLLNSNFRYFEQNFWSLASSKERTTYCILERRVPMASIYISTIIPRKSGKFINEIKDINKFLSSLGEQSIQIKTMNNSNINDKMLEDEKHLSVKGFKIKILLGNLRYVLFDIIPHIYVISQPYRSNRTFNNHSRNPHQHQLRVALIKQNFLETLSQLNSWP